MAAVLLLGSRSLTASDQGDSPALSTGLLWSHFCPLHIWRATSPAQNYTRDTAGAGGPQEEEVLKQEVVETASGRFNEVSVFMCFVWGLLGDVAE